MKLWSSEGGGKENVTNPSAGEDESKPLNFLDLLTIGIGSSFAVGVSVLLGGVIKSVAGPAVVVSICVAGATAFVGGLCFSEFGVRLIKSNSAYSYSYFWGRKNAAFIFGWALILEYVAGTASAAKGIIVFIDALTEYKITNFLKDVVGTDFHDVFPYFDFPSMGIVLILTVLIIFGMKDCLIIKKICTVCSVALVLYVITFGAIKGDLKNWQQTPDENSENGFMPFGVLGIIKGTAVAFYGFIGFDRVSVSGNEVRNQKRNIPGAILTTIFITLLGCLAIGISLTLVLPFSKLNPDAALPFAFYEIGWTASKWVVVVLTFFGFQTSLFGAMFPLPRIIQAMANDCLLFPFLANNHFKSKIPFVATLVGGLLTAAAAGILTFHKLVNLAIIGAFFVYTVLAINVILIRYLPKFDGEEMLSGSWISLLNRNAEVSLKKVFLNYFNFREKHPTNLTAVIMMGNIVVFCFSSIGLGVIVNFFFERLTRCSPEAVIPATILLFVMFMNLLSMICQPKSQEIVPFKVPLIPVVPCLSIFLNIFLMLTFESLTWILFICWMAIGLLPYFGWHFLQYLKGEVSENSLYEINKTNAIKLNESIWKIKSDKKVFYEGAVNLAFSDILDDEFDKVNDNDEYDINIGNEKSNLQLKQAEVLQTAEIALEEKVEPLKNQFEMNFVRVEPHATTFDVNENSEKVQWECVAEIHSQDEFPQESVVLEIVDNTYNFLTEVAEELSKDTFNNIKSSQKPSEKESLNFSLENNTNPEKVDTLVSSESESANQSTGSPHSERTTHDLFKEELLQQIVLRNKKSNERAELKNEYSNTTDKNNEGIKKEHFGSPEIPASSNLSKTKEKEQIDSNIVNLNPKDQLNASELTTTKPDDQNNVKIFKEKLNQLLKNHMNSMPIRIKNSSLSKSTETDEKEINNENNKKDLFNNVKTLNKSQIRGKLEVLLSKGPPKRASLRNSFNIKMKDTDNETESESKSNEIIKVENDNVNNRTQKTPGETN